MTLNMEKLQEFIKMIDPLKDIVTSIHQSSVVIAAYIYQLNKDQQDELTKELFHVGFAYMSEDPPFAKQSEEEVGTWCSGLAQAMVNHADKFGRENGERPHAQTH